MSPQYSRDCYPNPGPFSSCAYFTAHFARERMGRRYCSCGDVSTVSEAFVRASWRFILSISPFSSISCCNSCALAFGALPPAA